MAEPRVREDAIAAAHDIGNDAQSPLDAPLGRIPQGKSGREILDTAELILRPFESMIRVLNGAACFRRIVTSAEVLPLGSTHLRASFLCTLWLCLAEFHGDLVATDDAQSAEFEQPEVAVCAFGGVDEKHDGFAGEGDIFGVLIDVVIFYELCEVFLQLKG